MANNTYRLIVTVELSKQDADYRNKTLGECEARLQTESLKDLTNCNAESLISQLVPVARTMILRSVVEEEIKQTVDADAIEADAMTQCCNEVSKAIKDIATATLPRP